MKTFPFPHIINGNKIDGLLFGWPEQCSKCQHHACSKKIENEDIQLCSYGFNYQKINDKLTISGFIIKDSINSSPARQKNMSTHRNRIIQNSNLTFAIETLKISKERHETDIHDHKEKVIQEYIQSNQYKDDFLLDLRDEINKGLSFVHDYKQINAQIAQNINIIIENKYDGTTMEEKLSKASHQERAIYWASKFLTEKLNAARFLLHPDWITKESECDRFRFHGLFLKYLRIYQNMFEKKDIKIIFSGSSHKNIFGNPGAIGVIPHTLLDNSLKYSSRGSTVEIHIEDNNNGIYLSVKSFGPKIEGDELDKIFQPFYRGKHAIKTQEEGAGYGLYIAQLVAKKIGTSIQVQQKQQSNDKKKYETNFFITIPSE